MPDRNVPSRVRRQLAGELVRARNRTGLSARQLAEQLNKSPAFAAGKRTISPATISRIDNVQAASPPDRQLVETWLDVVAAPAETRERVLALAEAAYAEATRWSDLLSATGSLQGAVATREAASVAVDNFQPTFVPGLLQTPAYTRALLPLLDLPELDVEATVNGRIERQQVLYDGGRKFRFLVTEQVLAVPVGGRDTLAAQLDRLVQVAALEAVELRVLPAAAVAGAAWHGFVLHRRADDSEYATTELIHGTEQIHDADGVTRYRRLWNQLWSAAASGTDAVALVRAAVP